MKRNPNKKRRAAAQRRLSALVIVLNLLGFGGLIWFAVPLLTHDLTVPHPDAMLPAARWDMAGMALTAGLLPLLGANGLAWRFLAVKWRAARRFVFLPGMACALLVVYYWVTAL